MQHHPSGAQDRACSRAGCSVLSTVKVTGHYPGGFSLPSVAVVTQCRCLPVCPSLTWGAQQAPSWPCSAQRRKQKHPEIQHCLTSSSFAQWATANPEAGSYFNMLDKSQVPLKFVFQTVMTIFQVKMLWGCVLNIFLSMSSQPGFLLALATGPQQSSAWPMTWRPRAYSLVAKATALIYSKELCKRKHAYFLILENKSRSDLLHAHFLWHHNDTAVTLHCCSQGQPNSWKQAKTSRTCSEEQQKTKPTMLALTCPALIRVSEALVQCLGGVAKGTFLVTEENWYC